MTRFWEWLGRVIMLVLAGMITLSIIGAIAAIPSGSIETRLGGEPQVSPPPAPVEEPMPRPGPAPAAPEAGTIPAPAQTGTAQMISVPRPKPAPSAAEWLEAIPYALLALVGLGVVAILLLWRALHHWRRSADALELLAARKN